jgi:hypothetical protein
LICVKLTYHGQTMKADWWLHRTPADGVKTDAEIKASGSMWIMGEDMIFVKSKHLKTICAQCKREGF